MGCLFCTKYRNEKKPTPRNRFLNIWRRGRESNPSTRLCRPLHNLFSTAQSRQRLVSELHVKPTQQFGTFTKYPSYFEQSQRNGRNTMYNFSKNEQKSCINRSFCRLASLLPLKSKQISHVVDFVECSSRLAPRYHRKYHRLKMEIQVMVPAHWFDDH